MKILTGIVFMLFGVVLLPHNKLFSQDLSLHKLFDEYNEERLKLFPLMATSGGDDRYNDLLPIEGAAPYTNQLNHFYDKYLTALKEYKRQDLAMADRTSYDLMEYTLKIEKEGLTYHREYIPATQFFSLALTMGTLGAGTNAQPFKTVKDYENWLSRIGAFVMWVDTAVANFNKGIAASVVLPRPMVLKIIPQMEGLAETDTSKNIFYGPVRNFPESFSLAEKEKLWNDYHKAISTQLNPAYRKLATYLEKDYLPHARSTSGYSAMPGGAALYAYYVRYFTTTNKSPEEIYRIGLKEVKRMHKEMKKVKRQTHFRGSLADFFNFLTTDPKFFPFRDADEVLNTYRAILQRIEPHLPELFSLKPKTAFEIRQTESFRAASAAAQYFMGSEDGTRPGIFYVPIVDATTYPYFSMEDLFLHEAIPGHHYQISIQQENTDLPKLRRFAFVNAFSEGWALYTETLGKQLGLYKDPYQYLGFLQYQIHRAIRLVVDVGIHTGKMTREEAIEYMLENEPISEQAAVAEIERYMAIPGQALSYKIGQLKIEELRDKYKKQLRKKFNIKNFHDAILNGGSLPLTVFESYMDDWAKMQK